MKFFLVLLFLVTSFYSCHDGSQSTPPDLPDDARNELISTLLDTKLIVSGGEASSQEITNDTAGFENSYDGDFSTFWHSGWFDSPSYTITYDLKDANQLDYIMYYPRSGGGNGNFGEVEIYVSTEANPQFVKVKTVDLKKTGSPSKIVLDASVLKPKAVRFIILSGSNNNASCSEMEFYAKSGGPIIPVTEIPLGGNSYVTSSGPSNEGSVVDAGFSSWKSINTQYSTYFRVNESGRLNMYLKYVADGDGNVIQATSRGKIFQVKLPKPKTRQDTIIFIGGFENVEPGYVEVAFKGVTLTGNTFGTPSSLFVEGSSTKSMNYVGDFSYYWGRRGPSVHMNYPIPSDATAEWFYNEVTIPQGFDPIGSYFMVNGFGEGYTGMQVKSATERWLLFSVWSPEETDDPSSVKEENKVKLIKKGEGVTINDFGGEGSGGQSYMVYNWLTGNTYKFLNRIRPIENGYSEYTSYFYSPELGKWSLIAQWKRPKIQTYYTSAHSFVENFDPANGYLSRKAYFKNQWACTTAGKWVEIDKGTFSVDATGRPGWRMDYKGGLENGVFYLQDGGFFNDFVKPDLSFTRQVSGTQPNVNLNEILQLN